jgi:copper(I)-binding protein
MPASRRAVLAGAAGIGLLLAGCEAGLTNPTSQQVSVVNGAHEQVGPIKLSDVHFYPAGAPGAPSREYYQRGDDVPLIAQITNTSARGDRLVKVSSPDFGGVGYHGSHTVDAGQTLVTGISHNGGTAPSGQRSAPPAPGTTSARIILKDLRRNRFYSGPTLPVTFTFAKAGTVTLSVPMGAPRGTGQPAPPPSNPPSNS